MGITYEAPIKDRLHGHFLKSESESLDAAQQVVVEGLIKTVEDMVASGDTSVTVTIPDGGFEDNDYEVILAGSEADLFVSNLTGTTFDANIVSAHTLTAASAIFGELPDAQVEVTAAVAGTAANGITVAVDSGVAPATRPLSASYDPETRVLSVVLAMEDEELAGDRATVNIGPGGDNGVVQVEYVAMGVSGNDLAIEVLDTGTNLSLAATFVAPTLTVQLPVDGAGDIIPAEATALLVAAEIHALPEFTATASGTGEASFIAGEGSTPFAGGTWHNTATLVAAEIHALPEFTTTASGTGDDPITGSEDVVLSGGDDATDVTVQALILKNS